MQTRTLAIALSFPLLPFPYHNRLAALAKEIMAICTVGIDVREEIRATAFYIPAVAGQPG